MNNTATTTIQLQLQQLLGESGDTGAHKIFPSRANLAIVRQPTILCDNLHCFSTSPVKSSTVNLDGPSLIIFIASSNN